MDGKRIKEDITHLYEHILCWGTWAYPSVNISMHLCIDRDCKICIHMFRHLFSTPTLFYCNLGSFDHFILSLTLSELYHSVLKTTRWMTLFNLNFYCTTRDHRLLFIVSRSFNLLLWNNSKEPSFFVSWKKSSSGYPCWPVCTLRYLSCELLALPHFIILFCLFSWEYSSGVRNSLQGMQVIIGHATGMDFRWRRGALLV